MTHDDVPSRFVVDFTGATLLGIYRVDRKIADGGMGSVWLGEDTNLGRRVVVKVPHVRFLGEPGFRARFTREITELVRLEHPSIVRILAQGVHQEIPFFVLQYLGGGSLEQRRARAGAGPRGVDVVVPWLRTIAATLDFVHARGVVHRDVKPENILFDEEGHVFLSDFGLVKALDEDLEVTDAGTGVGSPKYMAPEQGLGRPVDGSADQYGLATVVYEALAGRIPFEGDAALEILVKKQREAPVPLATLAPDVPPACADAAMRGLAAAPGDRFPTCEAFADAFLAGAGIFDRTPSSGVPVLAAPRGARAVALGAVLVAVLALAWGWAAGWFAGPTPDGPDTPTAFAVTLLDPGAAPRHALRYRPAPGSVETRTVDIITRESKRIGAQEPVETFIPRVILRLRLEVTDVARNGDIAFAWKCASMSLHVAEGTPEPVLEALRAMAKEIEGRSGSARQTARGVHLGLDHDAPPPEDPKLQPLLESVVEILEQVATPLPEEPVGVGARWEVSYPRNREGIRFTQTVTFELAEIDGDQARLRIYVALAGLNQAFAHPGVPAGANARLKSGHGNGEGEVALALDRLGDRSVLMHVNMEMRFTVTEGDDEKELSVVREFRFAFEDE